MIVYCSKTMAVKCKAMKDVMRHLHFSQGWCCLVYFFLKLKEINHKLLVIPGVLCTYKRFNPQRVLNINNLL